MARKMGFEDECFGDSVEDMMDQALNSPNPWLNGLTRERLEKQGHVRLNFGGQNGEIPTLVAKDATRMGHPVPPIPPDSFEPFLPFANGNFRTPSGKAELYSERLKADGLDPVASFVPPDESRHTDAAKAFPLELLARKADNFLNSTFTNLPGMQALEETGLLEMNRADADARGIRN